MYGASNLTPSSSSSSSAPGSRDTTPPIPIKMITAAPEMGNMTALIPALTARDIIVSIGHSDASYEEASTAVAAGATMITHLFNAMRPSHHRDPGIFGVLGVAPASAAAAATDNDYTDDVDDNVHEDRSSSSSSKRRGKLGRPYFGIIADGIHLHPATINIAWNAHPDGFILVTDSMHMVGLPDGRYEWTNGEGEHFIVKKGHVLLLEGTGTIAGR
jgi:N-acetylglucosamine-6-phosphate deacetylase